jgi:hypothetical protein
MSNLSKADAELVSGAVFCFAMSLVAALQSIFQVLPMGMLIYMGVTCTFCIIGTVLLGVGTKDKVDELSQPK